MFFFLPNIFCSHMIPIFSLDILFIFPLRKNHLYLFRQQWLSLLVFLIRNWPPIFFLFQSIFKPFKSKFHSLFVICLFCLFLTQLHISLYLCHYILYLQISPSPNVFSPLTHILQHLTSLSSRVSSGELSDGGRNEARVRTSLSRGKSDASLTTSLNGEVKQERNGERVREG